MNKIFLFLLIFTQLSAKIRFFSFQYNRPEFLEFQHKLLKKFVLDDFELIVFNDARDPTLEIAIRNICNKNNIPYVRYEQEWHKTDPLNEYILHILEDPRTDSPFQLDSVHGKLTAEIISRYPGFRHCHVIQYALDHYGYDHDDIVVILDHDLFPMKPLSIRKLLEDAPLIGIEHIGRHGDRYLWVPFIAFDPKRFPNIRDLKFHCDAINHHFYDTGAASYHYLKNNPNVPYRMYPRIYDQEFYHLSTRKLQHLGLSRDEIRLIKDLPWPGCIEFYIDFHFLHYCGGYIDSHPIKQSAVLDYLRRVLNKE